ncbi:hypothetical protein [Qipengyuania sp. JC766]|uniref:hypothetical protein n=1 Tax=Qipengyuania sp. JC766 TaxID=3232139 RepID=UPI00345912B1
MHFFAKVAAAFLAIGLAPAALADTWHRADTHHFRIYSDGSKSDLEDFAREVEKFDALLRMLFKRPVVDQPTKLDIYMVSSANQVENLHGSENVAGFYRPSVEGSFAVSNREQTRNKFSLSGKETLFHEYAHHFFFNNFSIPAPAWFVEGFAEFVATAEFKKNDEWYFGKPAHHRAGEIEYFGAIDVRDLLTKPASEIEGGARNAFYGWSWILTHMLYSKEREHGDQLGRYLGLINSGIDPLIAAEQAFGDLDKLDSQMRSYPKQRMTYSKSSSPLKYRDAIEIVSLDDAASKLVELEMEVLSPASLLEARDELADLATHDAALAQTHYLLGLAEYRLANGEGRDGDETASSDTTAALASFEKALELDPDHPHANVYSAIMEVDRLSEAGDYENEGWDQARQKMLLANKADPLDPFPLYHFARSFDRQGKRSEYTGISYEAAFAMAPEAVEARVAYAHHLANEGNFEEAIGLVRFLANDPHRGAYGKAVLERFENMRDRGSASQSDGIEDVIEDAEEGLDADADAEQ